MQKLALHILCFALSLLLAIHSAAHKFEVSPAHHDAICCTQYASKVEQRLARLNLCQHLGMCHAQGVQEQPCFTHILAAKKRSQRMQEGADSGDICQSKEGEHGNSGHAQGVQEQPRLPHILTA
jgi:hypothetical protein